MGNSLNIQYNRQGEEVPQTDTENPEVGSNGEGEQSAGGEELDNGGPGIYYGSRYLLDSQRMLNTDAESILFGGLSSITSSQRPSFRPSRVHTAPTIKSAINLHKESLKLIKNDDLYQIQFCFDTLEDCNIKILISTGDPNEKSEYYTVVYPRGMNQTFTVPTEKALDLSLYDPASLIYQPEIGTYPITIMLDVVKDTKDKAAELCDSQEQTTMIESQTTFATFSCNPDSVYEIKPLKVTIQYGGAVYLVHDLYGSDAAGGETDGGRECVICMSDPRDITVWPCNHLCLCAACAELFRFQTDKCPICRSNVKALLKMGETKKNVNLFGGSLNEDSTPDEDSDIPLAINTRKEIMV